MTGVMVVKLSTSLSIVFSVGDEVDTFSSSSISLLKDSLIVSSDGVSTKTDVGTSVLIGLLFNGAVGLGAGRQVVNAKHVSPEGLR